MSVSFSPRQAATLLLAVAAGLVVALDMARADPLPAHPTKIVVFGDSLSDTGNVFRTTLHATPPSPPYFDGRFSNGPVWVEDFAHQFGLSVAPAIEHGTNFAVGGAKTGEDADSMRNQVDAYLVLGLLHGPRGSDPNALYVVFGGGDDLRDALRSSDPTQAADAAAENIGDIVETLADGGAVSFLVPNLPDKGIAPAARNRGTPAEEQALSIEFNAALDRVLADVTAHRALNIVRVDLFALSQKVVASPASFGFTDASDQCLVQQNGTFSVCSDPDAFVFWDDIHPTAKAHALIAQAALDAYGASLGTVVAAHP